MEFGGYELNFLDLQIAIENSRLDFNTYRKPTFTDTVILYDSSHPYSIKLPAFHSMLNRVLTILSLSPIDNGYNPEIKIIDPTKLKS